jgi:MOSC domain-containing protein YiiM
MRVEDIDNMEAHLLAVSIGSSAPLSIDGASPGMSVESAIRKAPISTVEHPASVEIRRLGLVGDEHVDLSVHGGLEKAVYLYPFEHYEWWRERRLEAAVADPDRQLEFGAFGENLTTRGLLEQDLWVGDRIVIGDVVMRVEAPRNPCFKFNAVMGYKRASKHMMLNGRTGVYLSVINTGDIRAGSRVEVVPGRREESIASLLELRRTRALREP